MHSVCSIVLKICIVQDVVYTQFVTEKTTQKLVNWLVNAEKQCFPCPYSCFESLKLFSFSTIHRVRWSYNDFDTTTEIVHCTDLRWDVFLQFSQKGESLGGKLVSLWMRTASTTTNQVYERILVLLCTLLAFKVMWSFFGRKKRWILFCVEKFIALRFWTGCFTITDKKAIGIESLTTLWDQYPRHIFPTNSSLGPIGFKNGLGM